MHTKPILGGVAALTAAAVLFAAPRTADAARTPDAMTFALDTVHSAIHFELTHLGVSHAWGRFNEMAGEFTFDSEDPTKSKVSIQVMADSVDTNNEKRDQHLRSADFFSAKQFPEIAFESKAVRSTGDKTMTMTGDLTFLGVTKEVEADVVMVGMQETSQGFKAGFNATMTIDRSEFGNDTYLESLGKDVTLRIALEGARR